MRFVRLGWALSILIISVQDFAACADEWGGMAESLSLETSLLSRYKLHKTPEESEKLPKILLEISGLAMTADGRLLTHDDEQAVVYELDIDRGKIIKSFRLGKKAVIGDFEGIAVAEGSLYLVTSDGILLVAGEGADGEVVDFKEFDTGVGGFCEVEGLEFDPRQRALLLACKTTRGSRLRDNVVIFRWLLATRSLDTSPPIRIPKRAVQQKIRVENFHPSGIALHPGTGRLFLLAAREKAIIEVTREGILVDAVVLKAKRHDHPEGIAIGSGKPGRPDLIISDEGEDGRARLTRYRMRRKARR